MLLMLVGLKHFTLQCIEAQHAMLCSKPISVLQTCVCVLQTRLQHAYADSERLYPRSFCFCLPMCHECTRFRQMQRAILSLSPKDGRSNTGLRRFRRICHACALFARDVLLKQVVARVPMYSLKQLDWVRQRHIHKRSVRGEREREAFCNGEDYCGGATAGDERAQHANLPYSRLARREK